MSRMRELAEGYRHACVLLRLELEDARAALKELSGEAYAEQRGKVAELQRALEQARDLRELCQRYYDRDYHPSALYPCSELKAPKVDATKEPGR